MRQPMLKRNRPKYGNDIDPIPSRVDHSLLSRIEIDRLPTRKREPE